MTSPPWPESVIFYSVERRPHEIVPCSHGPPLGGLHFPHQDCNEVVAEGVKRGREGGLHPCGNRTPL